MNTQTTTSEQRRPHIGLFYVQGLALYLWFRLVGLGEAVLRLLTAPFRWVLHPVIVRWPRLKAWLIRHQRRLIWSIVALVALSFLAGGVVTFYLWRHEVLSLAVRFQRSLSRLFRKATPVIIATAPVTAETVIANPVPGADGAGQ
ncbi:MAG: hypothetical protein JXM69_18005 [Anaerolineae bacterium]|nr:hypothetical protein [Anaerolineae bacterium]